MLTLSFSFSKEKDGNQQLWWCLIRDGETIGWFKELEFAERILEVARRHEDKRSQQI